MDVSWITFYPVSFLLRSFDFSSVVYCVLIGNICVLIGTKKSHRPKSMSPNKSPRKTTKNNRIAVYSWKIRMSFGISPPPWLLVRLELKICTSFFCLSVSLFKILNVTHACVCGEWWGGFAMATHEFYSVLLFHLTLWSIGVLKNVLRRFFYQTVEQFISFSFQHNPHKSDISLLNRLHCSRLKNETWIRCWCRCCCCIIFFFGIFFCFSLHFHNVQNNFTEKEVCWRRPQSWYLITCSIST